MNYDRFMCMTATTMLIAVISIAMFIPMAASSADAEYDQDLGRIYSMKVGFVFTGSDAETITWDFGDGSDTSSEMNPSHLYLEKGEYIVTQTTWNSYNGGSTTIMKFRIEVMGYPVVSFDTNGGGSMEPIHQTGFDIPADRPSDPSKEGCEFTGWYTDASCAEPYDWSAGVKEHLTLYAGWKSDGKLTISFDTDGGTIGIDSVRVEPGSLFTIPSYEGEKHGFTFNGWSFDDRILGTGESITIVSNTVLKAVWTCDGQEEESGSNENGSVLTSPATIGALIAILIMGVLITVRICRS